MLNASSCLLHVFCFAEYPYQSKSKRDKNLRKIILEYFLFLGVGINANGGPQPPRYTWVREATQAHGGVSCPPCKSVGALLRAQGSLYPEKNRVKISAQSSYGAREYKKRFSARSGERETEENREGDPISEELPPLHRHGDHGPEGEPSSHLGGGQGIRRRGFSPPRFRWRRSAAGARIVTSIYINNLATVNTNFLPLYAAV